MSDELFKKAIGTEPQTDQYAIAPGIVINNVDFLGEGRVQVNIPSREGIKPQARLVAIGAGMLRGFLWVPQVKDEVLVAFNQDDERDAYILGGLWGTIKRSPVPLPQDVLRKRVIRTGVTGVGHEIEFDDVVQSIKITSSTQQKITMNPLGIELSNLAGTVTINLDNKTQTVAIQAANGIELKAPNITQAAHIDIEGAAVTNIKEHW
jgi:uncharacterized protein involved in type VI secretion and phage assembly